MPGEARPNVTGDKQKKGRREREIKKTGSLEFLAAILWPLLHCDLTCYVSPFSD